MKKFFIILLTVVSAAVLLFAVFSEYKASQLKDSRERRANIRLKENSELDSNFARINGGEPLYCQITAYDKKNHRYKNRNSYLKVDQVWRKKQKDRMAWDPDTGAATTVKAGAISQRYHTQYFRDILYMPGHPVEQTIDLMFCYTKDEVLKYHYKVKNEKI